MRYYTIQDNTILIADNKEALSRFYDDIKTLPDDYIEGKYIVEDNKLVLNQNYEEEQNQKERNRLDMLTLTPSDVERALYNAKGIDFDDLKAIIADKLPNVDIKGLSIEFRAKDFWRGVTLEDGTRIFDVIGTLLGYTIEDIDYLFENKELPNKKADIEETQSFN